MRLLSSSICDLYERLHCVLLIIATVQCNGTGRTGIDGGGGGGGGWYSFSEGGR